MKVVKSGGCLDDGALWALLRHTLSPGERELVEAHLDGCPACRAMVASALRAGVAAPPAEEEVAEALPIRFLAAGTVVGRFVVLERVGAGAMGMVYSAYDPQLDRRVALKFLYAAAAEQPPIEARALARLSHPHVTAVHDVGTYGGHPYLALEFVAGETLSQWRARPAPFEARLRLLLQAGEGLIAAHRAGLVHRDFKPTNVLVAGERAWVTDFGLAGPSSVAGGGGTPAYMAPEQLAGGAGDERSDQFAFCVTAWLVLTGQHPFPGASLDALRTRQREPLVAAALPSHLQRALHRGLSFEPAARFDSVASLLAAMARPPPKRWPWAVLAAAAAGLVVADFVAQRPQCEDAATEAQRAWTDDDEARAREASSRAVEGLGPDRFAALAARLRDYRARVGEQARAVCLQRAGSGGGDALAVRRESCLHERAVALASVAAQLAEPRVWSDATDARVLAALPAVDACNAEGALPPLPDDAALRVEVLRLRETLSRFEAEWAMQRFTGQVEGMEALARDARRVGFAPLLAQVLRVLGRWQFTLGQYEAARQTLREAAQISLAAGDDGLAVLTWGTLSTLDAKRLGRLDEAEQLQEVAVALSRRPTVEPNIKAQALYRLGVVQHERGRLREAADSLQTAIDASARFQPHEGAYAGAITELAAVERELGFPQRSAVRLFALLETLEAHPELGPARGTDTLYELGRTLLALGRDAEAREVLQRARVSYAQYFGEDHVHTRDVDALLATLEEAPTLKGSALAPPPASDR